MLKIEFCDALDVWSFSIFSMQSSGSVWEPLVKSPPNKKAATWCKNVQNTAGISLTSTENSGGWVGFYGSEHGDYRERLFKFVTFRIFNKKNPKTYSWFRSQANQLIYYPRTHWTSFWGVDLPFYGSNLPKYGSFRF